MSEIYPTPHIEQSPHVDTEPRVRVADMLRRAVRAFCEFEDKAIRNLQERAPQPPEGMDFNEHGYPVPADSLSIGSHEHGYPLAPVSRKEANTYTPRHAHKSKHAKK